MTQIATVSTATDAEDAGSMSHREVLEALSGLLSVLKKP